MGGRMSEFRYYGSIINVYPIIETIHHNKRIGWVIRWFNDYHQLLCFYKRSYRPDIHGYLPDIYRNYSLIGLPCRKVTDKFGTNWESEEERRMFLRQRNLSFDIKMEPGDGYKFAIYLPLNPKDEIKIIFQDCSIPDMDYILNVIAKPSDDNFMVPDILKPGILDVLPGKSFHTYSKNSIIIDGGIYTLFYEFFSFI